MTLKASANTGGNADIGNGWTPALLGAAVGIALTLFALWPTVRGLAATWSASDSYRYGWLVVPTLVYLLGWHYRTLLLAQAPRPGFAGVLVALLAALLWGVSELMNVDVGRQLALVLALQSVAMSALGWRVYWRLFPILALLFLAIPTGDILLTPLRGLTLDSMIWFTDMVGMAPRVDGYVIEIGQGAYIVIDECAGLTFVTLGLFLGYSLGLMLYPSFVKAAALALAGAALAIVSNVVRVNAIVLIDRLRGTHMDLTAHSRFQTFALVLGIGLLFMVFYRLAAGARPAPAKPVAGDNSGRVLMLHRFAPALAGIAVLLVASILARMDRADQPQASCRAAPAFLPTSLLDWKSSAATPNGWSVDAQQQLRSVRASYSLADRDIQALVVEAGSATAKLPRAVSLAGEAGQWREKQVQTRDLCFADGCIKLRQTTWTSTHSGDQRHMVYAYQVGQFHTTSDLALRAFHGWARLTGQADRQRLVGLMYDGEAPLPDDVLARLFQSLQVAAAAHPC
ncbi:MAG: exosortase/archaeosortase family protein [Betaproteobacteria bacterium]